MLTKEQERTLEDACELFLQANQSEDNVASLELFNKAFDMLLEYIDDVDDIYYQLVFANCIEKLQRKGNVEFNSILIEAKTAIYVKALQWFIDASQYKSAFNGHLFIAFDALGRLLLIGGENVRQDDHYAYICYQCIKMLDLPMSDEIVDKLYLEDFVKDEATGKWKYIGVRPK